VIEKITKGEYEKALKLCYEGFEITKKNSEYFKQFTYVFAKEGVSINEKHNKRFQILMNNIKEEDLEPRRILEMRKQSSVYHHVVSRGRDSATASYNLKDNIEIEI
jgi:hypothetical protein